MKNKEEFEFKINPVFIIFSEAVIETIQRNMKPNDICLCGSGKKYKKCCRNSIDKNDFSDFFGEDDKTMEQFLKKANFEDKLTEAINKKDSDLVNIVNKGISNLENFRKGLDNFKSPFLK